MKEKSFTPEDVKKLIEEVRTYLKEDPLKAWVYIHSKNLSEEEQALLQVVWPTLPGWQKDSETLSRARDLFEMKIEKELNKIRRKELKKLNKEFFGE